MGAAENNVRQITRSAAAPVRLLLVFWLFLTPWIAAELGWTSAFFTAAALAVVGAFAWVLVDPTRKLRES